MFCAARGEFRRWGTGVRQGYAAQEVEGVMLSFPASAGKLKTSPQLLVLLTSIKEAKPLLF